MGASNQLWKYLFSTSGIGNPKNGASREISQPRNGSLNQSSSLFLTVSSTKPLSYRFNRNSLDDSNCKNRCLDFFMTGVAPEITDTGLMSSVGSKVCPQTSQESPYWSG